MTSKATNIGAELLSLARRTVPDSRTWQSEIHLKRGSLPASRNKFLACNAAELLFAWLRNDRARVREILDWWVWFATTPLGAGEDLTGEEVYRSLQAYSPLAAAGVAKLSGHADGYAAAMAIAKAHAAWLLLGAGAGPARKVRNHFLDKVGSPAVLVGDGAPVSSLPYIAQAGKRGWVRDTESGSNKFMFAESVGLSVIVCQAAGLEVPRKLAPWQSDLLAALQAFSPGLQPFGFSGADQAAARAFLQNPSDPSLARHVATWVEHQAPELPFTFVRYIDGSIVTLCEHAGASSTDSRMIDAWFADGRSMKTSADDGLRSSSSQQRGFELSDAFACQMESGGTVMKIPRPAVDEAWRVRTASRVVTFTVPGVVPPAPSVEPSSPTVPPSPPAPLHKRRGGCALLLASVGALAWMLA